MNLNEMYQEEEYITFTTILNNAGLFFLDKVAQEWNEYVDKICAYDEKTKQSFLNQIVDTEKKCKSQAEYREMYQQVIREMKTKNSVCFREFCNFRVDDNVFRTHHKYLDAVNNKQDISGYIENEKRYKEYIDAKNEKLDEVKKCRRELNSLQKEYDNFIQNTKAEYRRDLNMITNMNTKLKFQFQSGIKERLMADKDTVYQMIKSDEMLCHFNYLCRDMIKKINPDFFQTFSEFEKEELVNMFFNILLDKYKNNGIDFIQLVYERDNNDMISKLMTGKAFYMHFLVGFRNTIRRFMTMAYLSIHREHFNFINVDETFDNGKQEEDMGYDKLNYLDVESMKDMYAKKNKKVWTADNLLSIDTMNYWKYVKSYFLKNLDEMAKMTQKLFYESDKFYKTYDISQFRNALKFIIENVENELYEKNFIHARLQHYVYMAFGGSRGGKVYFVRETRFVQSVLMYFFCKYIKDFETEKGNGETYSQCCENLIEKVSENLRGFNLSDKGNDFVEEILEKVEIF